MAINESKTNYTKINRNITNLEQDLIMDGQVFEGVQNFRYLGALIYSKKSISDIKQNQEQVRVIDVFIV